MTITGAISGPGRLIKTGPGELVLTANGSYTGGTLVREGFVSFSDGGAFGDGSITLGDGSSPIGAAVGIIATAPVEVANSITANLADAVIGGLEGVNGAVEYSGSITLALISSGLSVFLVGGATSTSFTGAITGTGGIFADRPMLGGTVVLSSAPGANSFDGKVTVGFESELRVAANDQIPDTAGVQFLDGKLVMAAEDTVSFLQGGFGTVEAAGAAHTLTVGGNDGTGGFGGTLQDGAGGVLSLVKIGTGTQRLLGTNTYSGITSIQGGMLQIGDGSENGTLGTNKATVSSGATLGFGRFGQPNTPFVVGNLIEGAGQVRQLGAGIIALTNTNTYSGGTVIDNDRQIQMGTGGTTGTVGTGEVSVGVNGLLAFNRSDSLNFAPIISGAGGLQQVGAGIVTLTGANTFTGHSIIDAGLNLVVQNGIFGSVAIGNLGGLNVQRPTAFTATGVISGAGSVQQSGAGALTLAGANTYTGGTLIAADRTLAVGGAAGTLGTGSVFTNANSALQFTRTTATTIANTITGPGRVHQVGPSTITLTANNTYSGGTTIDAGRELFVSGGAATLGSGTVTNNGSLSIARTNAATFGNVIQGTGDVTQSGSGDLTFTGANTYAGGTTIINGSTLIVGNGGSLGTGGVTNDGTLIFNTNQPLTVTNVGGSGSVEQAGTGVVTLGGTVNYSGATTIDSSRTLKIGAGNNSSSFPSGAITNDGTLVVNRDAATEVIIAQAMTGSGGLTLEGTTDLTLTGTNTHSGTTTISGGVLRVGNAGTTGSIGTGAVVNNGMIVFQRTDNILVANLISGSGIVYKHHGNTLSLTANNTYSGGTEFAGTLQVGTGGSTGAVGTGTITTHGVLIFNRSAAGLPVLLEIPNAITGDGGIRQAGAKHIRLTGSLTYTGVTTIDSNTLLNLDTFPGTGNFSNDGLLQFESGTSIVYSGVISGSGIVEIKSTTNLTLAGTNTYSGLTAVESSATLRIGTGGSTGDFGTGTVNSEGVIVWNRTGITTLTRFNEDTRGTLLVQTGSLVLDSAQVGLNELIVAASAQLQLGFGNANGLLTSPTVKATVDGELTFNRSSSTTPSVISGVIEGGGTIKLIGNAPVTLGGQNTFTGTTILRNSGSMVTISGTHGTGPIEVGIGHLIFQRTNLATEFEPIANSITGDSGANLTFKFSSVTNFYEITTDSPFNGTVTVEPNVTVRFGQNGPFGSLGKASEIVNNGIVQFRRDNRLEVTSNLKGTGTFSQAGSGVTVLEGGSTMTGTGTPFQVSAGTLLVESTLVANRPAATPVVLIAGGTLAGSTGFVGGTVGVEPNLPPLSFNILSPGDETAGGTLKTGNVVLAGNTAFRTRISGSNSKASALDVLGTVNLANSLLSVDEDLGTPAATGTVFTILKNDGFDSVVGTFLNLPQGAAVTGGLGTRFAISYTGGTGNDVTLTVTGVAPTISNVDDQTILSGASTGQLAFTVGDAETPAANLTVTAVSSNQSLVPDNRITLGGSGASRTVTVAPLTGQIGTAIIALSVTDGAGLTTTESFDVIIQNRAPSISDVANQSVSVGQATSALPFTIGDAETAVGSLTVSAISNAQSLVPNGNIVIGGSGADRTVTVTPAAGQSGTATITLTVTDGNGATATDTFTVTVSSLIATTTTLSSSVNPSTPGQAVTFIAAVISSGGTPTGTITFAVDGVNQTPVNLNGSGVATFTTTTLTPSSHSILAIYNGSASLSLSTSNSLTQTVNRHATTTTLSSSVNPSNIGQAVTFTAAVNSSGGTPTGSITFAVDGVNQTPVNLSGSGQATFSTSSLSSGSHSITAVYSSDATHEGSTAAPLTQTVRHATTTTLSSSVNPSAPGQPVTFTASVASSGGTPTGTITFAVDGVNQTPASLNGSGVATFTTTSLSSGSHTITAVYNGSTSFSLSTSNSLTQTVQHATTTTLSSSVNPSAPGQSVTFTAAVNSSGGTPTGSITFAVDGVNQSPADLNGSGVATFITSSLTSGSHSITAIYSSDATHEGSTAAPLTQTVRHATTTTLSSSVNPSTPGQAVTFTATVTSSGGTPTGTVTFAVDGVNQTPASLNGSGVATFSTTSLSSGSHTITAVFNGNATFNVSTAAPLTHTVRVVSTLPADLIVTGPGGGNGMRYNAINGRYGSGQPVALFPGFGGEIHTVLGDLTGDGVLDIVVGTGPGSDTIRVLDGANDSVLAQFNTFGGYAGGVFVAVGDLNGDGKADVAVTPDAVNAFSGPVPDQLPVRVFDGASIASGSPALLAAFDGLASLSGQSGQNNPLVRLGGRPAIADMDGDGFPDLLVAAGSGGGPRVTVWDGRGMANANAGQPTRNPIANLFVFESTQRGGAFLTAGDVNGDGKAEVAVGGGPGGGPRVRIVNPAVLFSLSNLEGVNLDSAENLSNGLVLNNFFAGDLNSRGGVRITMRDLDGDGRAEVVTGSGTGEYSQVRIYFDEELNAAAGTSGEPANVQGLDPFGGFVPGGIWVG